MTQPAGVGTATRSGERASRCTFLGLSALLFAASAAGTIVWCTSMPAMDRMPVPGEAAMSMAGLPGAEQPWPVAAASFLGMWVVMTPAMMLPSVVPTLWRYREAMDRTGGAGPGWLAALVGLGYFAVWFGFGATAFPLAAALAVAEMREAALAGAVPLASGVLVLLAGCFQLTTAKARHLARCREAPEDGRTLPDGAGSAWRHGLRLGLHCVRCCVGLVVVLLVIGVADLRAMAVVAAAITAERLAPAGERVARATGVIVIAAGLFAIARAGGLG